METITNNPISFAGRSKLIHHQKRKTSHNEISLLCSLPRKCSSHNLRLSITTINLYYLSFFFSILSTVCMVHCRKNLRVINYVKETFPLIKDETFLNKNASYPIGSESKNLKRTSKFESLQIKLWKLLTSTLGALVKKLKGERFFIGICKIALPITLFYPLLCFIQLILLLFVP